MDVTIHKELRRGFTIAEVTMAVGIVAFGLVAVFSILPFGLTAQKDNREETIIRYEAEYWLAALQAGGLALESMDRVERVELVDVNGTVNSINRNHLSPLVSSNPGQMDLIKAARNDWPVDVCGWLSAPDYIYDNASPPNQIMRIPSKYARVWANNGPLFDRLYSSRDDTRPRDINGRFLPDGTLMPPHILPGGEFSFGYFLQTQVEPQTPSGTHLTLTFHWPITGPIEAALESGSTIHAIINDPDLAPPSQKSFTLTTGLRVQPALTHQNLNALQQRFMDAGQPGEELTATDFKAIFPTRKSWDPFDGGILNPGGPFAYMRKALIEDGNKFVDTEDGENVIRIPIKVRFPVAPNPYLLANKWEEQAAPLLLNGTLEGALQPSFISENEGGRVTSDEGLWLRINNSFGVPIAIIQIKKVENDHQIICSQPNPPISDGEYFYEVSFLDIGETWEDVFRSYERKGLGDYFTDIYTGQNKWRFGAIHKSKALHFVNSPTGDGGFAVPLFSVSLGLDDYGFEELPPGGTSCSFWFLR